jgi:hypothetical protein
MRVRLWTAEQVKQVLLEHRMLIAVLAFVTFVLVLFGVMDNRPPDDHDDFYTAALADDVWKFEEASPLGKLAVLGHRLKEGPGQFHPQLAQTFLVAAMGTFGRSVTVFRLANLPFLLLLVFGTYLLARELSGARLAVLAAFVVGTLPIVTNYSRKWDIQFHAAALTPLGLYLGLRALRSVGRDGWKWWIGLGIVQGLRMHTHPIVISDVAVTFAILGAAMLPMGRIQGASIQLRIRQLIVALGVTHLISTWMLGVYGNVLGEPGYSLHHYLPQRIGGGGYLSTAWWGKAILVAQLGLVLDLVREVQWLHLMRTTWLLLLPGIIAAPVLLLWRGTLEREDSIRRWQAAVIALAIAIQVPPILLATSNKAFLNDWLYLVPGGTVLALVAMDRIVHLAGAHSSRLRLGWSVALVANGILLTLVPLGVSLAGPEPMEKPEFYDQGPLWPFTRSTSGRHFATHHLVSRWQYPGERIAQTIKDNDWGDGTARLGILDLSWDPSYGGQPGCNLGDPSDAESWLWSAPEDIVLPPLPPLSPWPFSFVGFKGLQVVRPEGEERGPRFTAVRLWLIPRDTWIAERQVCRPSERLPENFLAGARAMVEGRLGSGSTVEVLADPTGWLLATVIEWDREPSYLGTALLVDRRD